MSSDTTPPVGSRWLPLSVQAAQRVRGLEAELATARRQLDATLSIAQQYIPVTDLAAATGLSRPTIYKARARTEAA